MVSSPVGNEPLAICSPKSRHTMWKLNLISPIVEEQDVFPSTNDLLLAGEHVLPDENKWKNRFKTLLSTVLVLIWIACSAILMANNERVHVKHLISISENSTAEYIIREQIVNDNVLIQLEGALLPKYYANLSANYMEVWMQLIETSFRPENISALTDEDIRSEQNISEVFRIPTVSGKLIGTVPEVAHKKVYKLYNMTLKNYSNYYMRVKLKTNVQANFPLSLTYNVEPINEDYGVIYAAVLLLFLYILMIFELVHRTLAAMLVSTMSLAVLAAHNDRPTLAEIISWMDVETLLLLFSMMTMVSIFTETGIFDYLSVLAYKVTKGRIWPLVNILCIFTAISSCFLDNVTTALLMTPITIRLCEVLKLNPVPVLINMIVYSNIGGALTPIGDPPNVIIASNPAVIASGVNFVTFTMHMSAGVILSLIAAFLQLKFIHGDITKQRGAESEEVQDLRREIAVWKRTAASMSSYSREEDAVKDSLMKRIARLIGKLNTKTHYKDPCGHDSLNIKDLEAQYPIKDKKLLIKCTTTLVFVILAFFLQTMPIFSKLSLGWIAFLGSLLLLILSQRDDMEGILGRVEWCTLLFFAALFILMEALARLGLIDWVGEQTINIVMSVTEEARLTVAILLMLWVSAAVSAFVDNIPLTTMMIHIAVNMAENSDLNLPLQPLIWSLSFGACLGGNGTLFGSSSNIICAGVAEQHGYRFSFIEFMKVGVPITISSLTLTTAYLLIAHVWFSWH